MHLVGYFHDNKKGDVSIDYSGRSERFVSHPRNPEQLLDPTLPLCQRVTRFFLPMGENDHIPPSSAEVKNEWSCAYISLYAFLGWDLVKHRDNF